jgi:hypothetical protein
MTQWVEGTLFDNVDKFATALGYDNAGVILPLAMVPWQSVQDRNNFIQMLTDKSEIQGIQTNHLSNIYQKAKVK